jgi:hypothetical protein
MNAIGWSALLIYPVLLAGYYLLADRTVMGRA